MSGALLQRGMRTWGRIGRALSLSACVWVCLLVVAGAALAGEARPLRIAHFSLQTTRTRQTSVPLGHENWGFVNEPVAFTQAGGHPNGQDGGADSLTFSTEFEHEEVIDGSGEPGPAPTRDPRDIAVLLPNGLLGNPTAVPRCPLQRALSTTECPPGTQVGEIAIYLEHGEGLVGPIVNVVPEAGQSAEFAIETNHKISFLLTAHVVRVPEETVESSHGPVHKPEGYGLTVVDNSIPMTGIYKVELSWWGVPSAKIHDPERGLFCGRLSLNGVWGCENGKSEPTGNEPSSEAEIPFLTMPSNCAEGPETAVMRADSWEEPGRVGVGQKYENYVQASTTLPAVGGCDRLGFSPGLEIQPDTTLADAPVGMGINLPVPQYEEPQRPATPELRKSVISFPLGMSVSPGIVDGIQACNETGREGINFTGVESEERGLNGELQLAPGHCPDASIVGTAEASTPLLSVPIKGHVYLARPGCGNAAFGQRECTAQDALDGNLYQLYMELGGTGELADTGVNIKVRFKTEANPATGQLTAVAEEIAQLPFSELRIRLNGGPRAPLDNPATCGPARTTADFTTWAASGVTPEGIFTAGLADATPFTFYTVQGCANPPGLSPGFVAGTVTPNAGKFSAFTLNISRKDREQYIKGIQVHTPPGLLGMLSTVPLCGEAQASTGTCPESSKIGTTRVASGAGSHPFEIEGAIYLTEAYRGAPFGLSIVTHAIAGPFNLGLVIVRARIDVDPVTSTLTITTDETGPYALPQIVFGVPLRLQRVTVNVDRPGFMFNPTNCSAQQITATISGTQQAVADVSSPFAVGNCTSLAFKPVFKVSTTGHTTRKTGASLDAKLSYPAGAMTHDANIARVKVSLPKQLPSYLPTLQKACLAATFEANPAACPQGAIVGIARASTPLLPVGLSGPVYFVSHGGEEFPSLIVVLQGYGVRVDLTGSTFIDKKTGITSSTFNTIPDVPVNTFELYLPQGANHALAANGNLCKRARKLLMPTQFTAQNGMTVRQNTKLTVTGCAQTKRKHSKHKHTTRKASKSSRSNHKGASR